MTRAIVIALSADGVLFAIETEPGLAVVCRRLEGPSLRAGDIVSGDFTATTPQSLRHGDGVCTVIGQTGPLERAEALARLGSAGNLR